MQLQDLGWARSLARRDALELALELGEGEVKESDRPMAERGLYRAVFRLRASGAPHDEGPGPLEWMRLGEQSNHDRVSFSASLFRSVGPPWLVDSGASVHAISDTGMARAGIKEVQHFTPFPIATANGERYCDKRTGVHVHPLGVAVTVRIRPATTRSLSVGMLCMESGCTFAWKANSGAPTWCFR